jgi:hypothetical protein
MRVLIRFDIPRLYSCGSPNARFYCFFGELKKDKKTTVVAIPYVK